VSRHTVKFHVNSIMGKLNAQSRIQAVTVATRLGLLPV
jgi:DNA-binding NarL/FixJ family response regulator